MAVIRPAGPGDMADVAALFREYAASLDIDLLYQGFEDEVAGLPGAYASPTGMLLLAYLGNHAEGCVAVRPLSQPGECEMKRLYARAEARGTGLGMALAVGAIGVAQALGYRCMRLDTLPSMLPAQALYRRLGFEVTPAYYDSPVPGTIFMRKILS